ncbi:MAG: hypothetical protein P4L96_14015 [Rhodoferax sp.]|nr:hypothetical protein [Rhodoferax sp.]
MNDLTPMLYERTPETPDHFLWEKEKSWVAPLFIPTIKAYAQSLHDYPPVQKGAEIGVTALVKMLEVKPADK